MCSKGTVTGGRVFRTPSENLFKTTFGVSLGRALAGARPFFMDIALGVNCNDNGQDLLKG